MTNRRSFLASLAAIAGVGALTKRDPEPFTGEWAEAIHSGRIGQPGRLGVVDSEGYEGTLADYLNAECKTYVSWYNSETGESWPLSAATQPLTIRGPLA